MTFIEKTYLPCNVCGDDRYTVLYPDELGDRAARVDYDFSSETSLTYQIVRCRNCGFVFTNPMPNLDEVYANSNDEVYLDGLEQRRKTAAKSLRSIVRIRNGGTLLDIGCATGIFLDEAAEFYETEGIELSRASREIARKRHTVYDVPLAKLNKRDSYDVITLWGVIEHFRDPATEIAEISRALKPGGIVAIYTGDVDSMIARLLGKKWWWYMGMHLCYFSYATCSRLLEQHGLVVESHRTHTTYFKIRSLGRSLQRYKFGKLAGPICKIPMVREICIPLQINGEMLILARKSSP